VHVSVKKGFVQQGCGHKTTTPKGKKRSWNFNLQGATLILPDKTLGGFRNRKYRQGRALFLVPCDTEKPRKKSRLTLAQIDPKDGGGDVRLSSIGLVTVSNWRKYVTYPNRPPERLSSQIHPRESGSGKLKFYAKLNVSDGMEIHPLLTYLYVFRGRG
jgi:hypothetical protein